MEVSGQLHSPAGNPTPAFQPVARHYTNGVTEMNDECVKQFVGPNWPMTLKYIINLLGLVQFSTNIFMKNLTKGSKSETWDNLWWTGGEKQCVWKWHVKIKTSAWT
jgi:hypothetical protein